jgi:hypothetical protein
MPGLGQGHGKKRHLHAHSPVNFKELKCYVYSIIDHIATLKDRYTSSEASPQTDPAAAGMRIIIPLLEAK